MIKTGDKLFNFTVTRVRESKELSGRLVELKHDKVGTEVCWVDNGEVNKLFSITFKTLPSDSTGVFHILEHSVLCGSEKYPVKEPFVDLLKSSMNTFLNAMTFQDKTMYPVSSRNAQDYLNLAGVYLDAVFAPAILKNKNIFYQEGWHIEQDEELSYKGVVFNEMKGAMASKDELMIESLLALMFKDNCYGFNSGGDPAVIPTLTYEKFIETYKKHYHPSNARVFLDGSVPIEETLSMLDDYLSKYEKSEDIPEVSYQVPFAAEETIYYALGEEEELKDKGQLTIAKIVGKWDNPVKNMAIGVVFNALSDSNDAPFKKALLESGLAQDLDMTVNDDAAQTFISIDAKNIQDGKDAEVIETIKRVAKEQVEKGIDRKALIASINSLEYKIKAPEEPAGLLRAIKSMLSWLYGGDPMMYLECDEYFKK
ncbi:MAG: insulinase family protein, partial [Clostridia bacterium]|nr:insulinase family protein [Clostridia bacterium]